MKILLHCGSGNTDRPHRWSAVYNLFHSLSQTLLALGHKPYIMVHPEAISTVKPCGAEIPLKITSSVDTNYITQISPHAGITWNGNSPGDKIFVSAIGRERSVYGELGYFGHYDRTCYFDRCGVNTRHSLIGHDYEQNIGDPSNLEILSKLQQQYKKSKIFDGPYIFVPLQDESDTQIYQYSPFKTMDEFLLHVLDVFRFSKNHILFKPHPRAETKISVHHEKLLKVSEDVHHYLPYAKFVCGINSTVMVESLLYHGRIISYGAGITSRNFSSEEERIAFIAELYKRQLLWSDLNSADIISKSHLNKILQDIERSS